MMQVVILRVIGQERGPRFTKRRRVYVMDIKVRRSKEGAVEGVPEEHEEVFSGLGADLI